MLQKTILNEAATDNTNNEENIDLELKKVWSVRAHLLGTCSNSQSLSELMITELNSLKGRYLQKCDRISLCVQNESLPYKYVTVEGPFEYRKSDKDQLLAMATRYLGEEQGALYASSPPSEHSIVVTIQPDQWLSTDYSRQQ